MRNNKKRYKNVSKHPKQLTIVTYVIADAYYIIMFKNFQYYTSVVC